MQQTGTAETAHTIGVNATAIDVHDLVTGFDGQQVLKGVTLSLMRGEILGLVGGSGAGKSVFLRTLIGLLPKWSGQINVLDCDYDAANDEEKRSIQRRWGVLFQGGALFSGLTVLQNIQFLMREYLDISPRLRDEIAMTKLEMVGLKPTDAHKLPSELSGGMTKRAALARALSLDPDIVFLDEPTSGLDPISAGDFDALIKTLQTTLGLTVFMVTHDLESLYTICDRVAVLADGKVVEIGPLESVVQSSHPWVNSYFSGKRGSTLLHRPPSKIV